MRRHEQHTVDPGVASTTASVTGSTPELSRITSDVSGFGQLLEEQLPARTGQQLGGIGGDRPRGDYQQAVGAVVALDR